MAIARKFIEPITSVPSRDVEQDFVDVTADLKPRSSRIEIRFVKLHDRIRAANIDAAQQVTIGDVASDKIPGANDDDAHRIPTLFGPVQLHRVPDSLDIHSSPGGR